MDLALLVYGISVLSSLKVLLIIALVVTTVCFVGAGIGYLDGYSKEDKITPLKWLKGVVVSISIILPLLVIVPSEKTMYTMVGAYAAQKVVEDPKVQQLSAKVLKIVESKLDAYILEDSKPKK